MNPEHSLVDDLTISAGFSTTRGIFQALQRRLGKTESVYAPGYVPPVAHFRLPGEPDTRALVFRETDLPVLAQLSYDDARRYVGLIIEARAKSQDAATRLDEWCLPLLRHWERHYDDIKLVENEYVVPSTTLASYTEEQVSQKGSMLLHLCQEGYPVPDFAILTSRCYAAHKDIRERCLADAISNLEKLTGCRLGSQSEPLLFAMRCAMPSYIPGFMPTYLNVGATESCFDGLGHIYGRSVALKIYLNNLKNLFGLLYPDQVELAETFVSSHGSTADHENHVRFLTGRIGEKDRRLLRDPTYQVSYFVEATHHFFENNSDLLFTFTHGQEHFPSLILQKMVITVRSESSYPGVLYSRHPRTGQGRLLESAYNIFGEEIMTGTVAPNLREFADEEEIRDVFPAVSHFSPLLEPLERKLETPVTIEFAAETAGPINYFALLQLNPSEMTGRATLVSTMDMYNAGIIRLPRITELVKPYHLRQSISDSIHESSFATLDPFAKGISVLPRSAVTARAYFSATAALEAKQQGEKVCFCKQSFIPSDTIIMGEMDAILSLTPVAIHVVTACRGFGIPALLNLESHGAQIVDQTLVNHEGKVIREGDWITLSSKRQELFIGQATYTPARFQKYLDGVPIELAPREKMVFDIMACAFRQYQAIIREMKASQIDNVYELIRLVRNDLRHDGPKAAAIINSWYDANPLYYAEEILVSKMGSHLDHDLVFGHLTVERRADFFKHTVALCRERGLCGFGAGSFMLGRFLNSRQKVAFWNALDDCTTLFCLNEWVLFQKYIQVLYEVGERRISKARQKILNEGLGSLSLRPAEVRELITLKLARKSLAPLLDAECHSLEPETTELVRCLEQPMDTLYDTKLAWEREQLERLYTEEGIAIPS